MEILIKAGQFILSLSLIIILHELGHFVFARIFNTRVEKFYLFFNPWFSLFKKKIGDTEYGIGWLPLGGFVKISGMIDESMDKEQLLKPPQPYEFRSKPSYQRLLIMIGGVLVNFIFAILIYAGYLYTWGESFLPVKNMTYGIMVDSTGMEMGLRNGDKILSLEGNEIYNYRSIVPEIALNNYSTIQIEREGRQLEIELPDDTRRKLIKYKGSDPISPRIPFYVYAFTDKDSIAYQNGIRRNDRVISLNGVNTPFFDQFRSEIRNYSDEIVSVGVIRNETDTLIIQTKVNEDHAIGVIVDDRLSKYFTLEEITYTLAESFPAGLRKGVKSFKDYIKQLGLLFDKETEAYKEVGGFIAIGNIFPGKWSWPHFWTLTAFLSIILAIMNILPIPALDGGHVAFLLFEMITGRKPGDKFMEYAQIAGMIILLSLLIFANGQDIIKLFNK